MPADSPTPGDIVRILDEAVALSRDMLDAARRGDWDALASLEQKRFELLGRDLLARLSTQASAQNKGAKAAIEACLRLNDEIAALTGAHMARLGALLAGMAQVGGGDAPSVPASPGTAPPQVPPHR